MPFKVIILQKSGFMLDMCHHSGTRDWHGILPKNSWPLCNNSDKSEVEALEMRLSKFCIKYIWFDSTYMDNWIWWVMLAKCSNTYNIHTTFKLLIHVVPAGYD